MGDGRNYGDGSYSGDPGLTYTENLNRYEDFLRRETPSVSSSCIGTNSDSSTSSGSGDELGEVLSRLIMGIFVTIKIITFVASLILIGLLLCFWFYVFVLTKLPKEIINRRRSGDDYTDIFFDILKLKQFSVSAYDFSKTLAKTFGPTAQNSPKK